MITSKVEKSMFFEIFSSLHRPLMVALCSIWKNLKKHWFYSSRPDFQNCTFFKLSPMCQTKLIELSHTIDIQLFLQLVAMHQYIQLTGSWNRNQKNCLHLKHTDVNTFSPRSTFQKLATFSNYLTHSTTVTCTSSPKLLD